MQNYNPQLSQKLVRFGDPIPFGESVSFVCEKGMAFEEDYHQTSFEVTCQVKLHFQSYLRTMFHLLDFFDQDGSESGSTRGYFLVPEEDEWPKCVRGEKVLQALKICQR